MKCSEVDQTVPKQAFSYTWLYFSFWLHLGLLTKWCFWAAEAQGQWYVFPGEPLAVSSTSYLTCPLPLLFLHPSIPFISRHGTVSSSPTTVLPFGFNPIGPYVLQTGLLSDVPFPQHIRLSSGHTWERLLAGSKSLLSYRRQSTL